MLTTVYGAGLFGIDGFMITVECNCTRSIDNFEIVGLPDAAVKESKQRVETAIVNSGISYAELDIKINLAPADMKKEGSSLDLPIAVSILKARNIIHFDVDTGYRVFLGELSFSGEVRPINGILNMTITAKEQGYTEVFVPEQNANEASVVDGITVYPVKNLARLIQHLNGGEQISPMEHPVYEAEYDLPGMPDFSDVKGQERAKRALEIAAAGGHNVLMIGPPGSGKSMLAKRIPSILPELSFKEALETTKIHSASGYLREGESLITKRPFRSPHHTMSAVSLAGGGRTPKAGEISLAHNGVLFLDELPEFNKNVTESLRQPMEDGKVTITRISASCTFPSSFMLVCAMNPCKCGYYGSATKKCTCKKEDIKKYLARISGPLLDRMDIQVEVPALSFNELSDRKLSEPSSAIRKRVEAARKTARERFANSGINCNSAMTTKEIREYCQLDGAATALMKKAFEAMGMSGRGYDKVLRVARTIADLDNSEAITSRHIAEAIQFRTLDKKYF